MPALEPYLIEPIWSSFGPPSRATHGPSARMPPLAHPREGGLREAGAGFGLRLRLPQDRRRILLGEHAACAGATSG